MGFFSVNKLFQKFYTELSEFLKKESANSTLHNRINDHYEKRKQTSEEIANARPEDIDPLAHIKLLYDAGKILIEESLTISDVDNKTKVADRVSH